MRPEGIELAHVWERVMDTLCRTSADARVPLTDMWLAFTLFAKCNRGAYDTGVACTLMRRLGGCAVGLRRAPLADLKARMFARVLGDGESVTPACARRIVEILILTERASLRVCIYPICTGTRPSNPCPRPTQRTQEYTQVRAHAPAAALVAVASTQAMFRATHNVQQKSTL